VKDNASGHLGSIHIDVDELTTPPTGNKTVETKNAAVTPQPLR